MNLPQNLTDRIQKHLAKVKNCLRHLPPDEQQEILQTVETHIHEDLARRSKGSPSAEVLEAVIAEMDPPESYGSSTVPFRKKKTGTTVIALSGLILIIGIIAGIKLWPRRPIDPVGHWISVDFVSTPEEFDPQTRTQQGDLYLKELTFLPDGKTDRLYWTWKESVLHHSGDNTDAKFLIKWLSGQEYLFLEWMSGDVIHKGQQPKYYVLKKTDRN